jgi:hypothetical protein
MAEVGGLVAAFSAFAVAVGGYVQFVLRRSIFPCIEYDVNLSTFGRSAPPHRRVGEMVFSIRNAGPGIGFVTNLRCRVRYRLADDSGIGSDGVEPAFTHALTRGFTPMHESQRNFIQPGVTQWYRKPLAVPQDTRLIHIWGTFEYHIEVGRITWVLAGILTQRPEQRLVMYTVRRTFDLGDD